MEKQGSKQNTANISQHIQRVSNFSLFDVRAFRNIFSDNKSKHFSLSVCVCVCVCVCVLAFVCVCLCLYLCDCIFNDLGKYHSCLVQSKYYTKNQAETNKTSCNCSPTPDQNVFDRDFRNKWPKPCYRCQSDDLNFYVLMN